MGRKRLRVSAEEEDWRGTRQAGRAVGFSFVDV
ncbi:hypothetical protein CCACVL1_17076 [Corchorus capsularis]|uniref:Uncharacterized protein n=1 Tax=Corchorus capsularis TaxID=210143 RepID=A0A1R3HU80_COCAP|nr:hypothetical protein CCACVL1_17076 [Corchorus capsularis]